MKIAERLKLAPDRNRHLMPGRIEVANGDDDQRPAVFVALLRYLVNERVADLARSEI